MTAEEKKAVRRLVSNAWKLAATPTLTLDDCDGKYYAGYEVISSYSANPTSTN